MKLRVTDHLKPAKRWPWLGPAMGLISLAGLLIPVARTPVPPVFAVYKAVATTAIAAMFLSAGALLLARRRRRLITAGAVAGTLTGAYALAYAVIAHQERDRAIRLTACAVRLTYL
jgi:hypothetical protein